MFQSVHREEMSLAAIKLNRPSIEISWSFLFIYAVLLRFQICIYSFTTNIFIKFMISCIHHYLHMTDRLDSIAHLPFIVKLLIVNFSNLYRV